MSERGDLEQFVFESITQVAAAVSAAQEPMQALGGRVNPVGSISPLEGMAIVPVRNDRHGYVQKIEFDIAVTREAGESSGVGGGIKVFSMSAGANTEASASNSSLSRLRFTLPIVMPGQPDEETEAQIVARRKEEVAALQRARDNAYRRF